MGTISDKLVYLGETKAQIRTAIQNKGVTVPANTPFRDYATKIGDIAGGGGFTGDAGLGYVRPQDWIEIPDPGTSNMFYILWAVYPGTDHENSFSFRVTTSSGQFNVDFGDGTSANYSSGSIIEKKYTYEDISPDTFCSRGYRQVLMRIQPVSGNITLVDFGRRPAVFSSGIIPINMLEFRGHLTANTTVTLNSSTLCRTPLLEKIKITGSNLSSWGLPLKDNIKCVDLECNANISFTTAFTSSFMLEEVKFHGTGTISMASSQFGNCYNLKKVTVSNPISNTNWASAFSNCYSLRELNFPNITATTLNNMFLSCFVLKNINFTISSAGTSNFSGMFNNCYSLQEFPALNMSGATNVTNFNSNALAIRTMPLQNLDINFTIFPGTSMNRDALVELFNLLPNTVRTITITSVLGAPDLSQADRNIATNKGWTIIG